MEAVHGDYSIESLVSGSICCGNEGILNAVLCHVSDINELDWDGETMLHVFARRGFEQICVWLLDMGADVNKRGKWGETPLWAAIQAWLGDGSDDAHASYREDMCRLLLDRGADINTRNGHGETVLHAATECGHVRCLQFVLHNLKK